MNLKGRYDMLRQATLQMVGIPTDDLDQLKQMAAHLQIPAMHDPDAAVSLLVLQTLIATHGGGAPADLCEDEGCPHHGVPHLCFGGVS